MGPLVNDRTAMGKREGRNLSFILVRREEGVGFVGRESGGKDVAGLVGSGMREGRSTLAPVSLASRYGGFAEARRVHIHGLWVHGGKQIPFSTDSQV